MTLSNTKLALIAAAVSSALLSGCNISITDKDDPKSPEPQPTTFEKAQGAWHRVGYGEWLKITADRVLQYQSNGNACIEIGNYTHQQVEEFTDLLQLNSDNNRLHLIEQGATALYGKYFEKQQNLALVCADGSDESQDPIANFEYFWHSFDRFYAFFDERGVDWQATYNQYRPLVTATTTDDELFTLFAQMVTPLKDGHVSINDGDARVFRHGNQSDFNQYLIKRMVEAELSGEYSTEQLQQMELSYRAAYRELIVSYVGDGDIDTYPQGTDFPLVTWAVTDDNVGIIKLDGMSGYAGEDSSIAEEIEAARELFDHIMSELADTDGLIIDARSNNGGLDAISLLVPSYFTDVEKPVFTKQAINNDGIGDLITQVVTPAPAHFYDKPVYVATSRSTASAGETFLLAMQHMDNAQLIGHESWGALSDIHTVVMPNLWQVGLSNETYKAIDGTLPEVVGVQPDVYLPTFTASDFSLNQVDVYEYVYAELGIDTKPEYSQAELEADIAEIIEDANFAGIALSAVAGDEVVWQGNYGVADEDATPVTSDTAFLLASVSKTMTGTVMAHMAVEQGLDLDDAIDDQLSFSLAGQQDQITLRRLATHTSGVLDSEQYHCAYFTVEDGLPLLPLIDDDYVCETGLTELEAYLASYLTVDGVNYTEDNVIDAESYWPEFSIYSNVGVGLASHIIDKRLDAVDDNFDAYSENRIFEPLNMNNTAWHYQDLPATSQVVTQYEEIDGESVWVPHYETATYADGGLLSSTNDMSNFLIAVINEGQFVGQQVLNEDAVDLMLTQQSSAIGLESLHLGLLWGVDGNYILHSGNDFGTNAHLFADNEQNLGMVMLSSGPLEDEANTLAFSKIKHLIWQYLNQ